MEWYFRNEIDDLVVPKYHQQWEMVSSPDSWSPWGISAFGGSDFPKKNFNTPTKQLTSDDKPATLNSSMDIDDSSHERQHSVVWNDEQDRIDRMHDLFFGSLLEEEPTQYSIESHDTMIPADNVNIFKGDMLSSHDILSHGQSMTGCSKYPKTHASENREVSSTCQMLKYTSEENTMEESVLQELERVTGQFTDTTRICFRDALYRLAENSKQTVNSCTDGEPNDDAFGAGKTQASESETNAIDRAVANLMYSKICFDVSYDQHVTETDMDVAGDAEVPIAGLHDSPQLTFNLYASV